MDRIVVLGGTGFIGTRLVEALQGRYMVVVLTRSPGRFRPSERVRYVGWDAADVSESPVDGALAVINLAGESIAGRWTKRRKDRVARSRIQAARYVAAAIRAAACKPAVWIQASATGFYGSSSAGTLDEGAPRGAGFLAQVCEAWERPARELNVPGVRVVIARTGLVLSPEGGLWRQLGSTLPFGLGLVPGSGRQRLPWIAMADEVGALLFLMENDACEGVFNLAAPHSCTMGELVGRLGRGHLRLFTLRVPGGLLRLLLGREMADEVVLTDQCVAPARLLLAGYKFACARIDTL